MAIEGRTRRPGDFAPLRPQSKHSNNSREEEKSNRDEGDPEERIELPSGVVPEQLPAGVAALRPQLGLDQKP